MSSFTNCSNNLIHVQLYIDLSFVLHQLTINDDEQIFKSKPLTVWISVKNVRFYFMKGTEWFICTVGILSVLMKLGSMNQIWNHMMFRLLRHSQWTEMTFQIEGWYVTGLDIVKWHGRWEKHAFMKVCIITTSPRIEHLAEVFVAARTGRLQQFHKLTLVSYTSCFIKTPEQLH